MGYKFYSCGPKGSTHTYYFYNHLKTGENIPPRKPQTVTFGDAEQSHAPSAGAEIGEMIGIGDKHPSSNPPGSL